MILAELSAYDPPLMIGVVLGCLMFLVVGANYAMDLVKKFQGKPGLPPNEQLQSSHQHLREEFNRHVIVDDSVHKDLFHKLGGAERGLENRLTAKIKEFDGDAKESRAEMHRQIGEVSNEVSSLKTHCELTNQRVVQIDGKLDRLIERKNDS